MSLVLRNQWESYMDCSEVVGSPDYNLIGEGFTSFPESKNPKRYVRKYHEDKTEQTDVVGYAPSIGYSCDIITDDPVVKKIVEITDQERIGVETRVDIVSVNLWQETCAVGVYKAFKRTFSIVPDGRGDGTDALIYTGTMEAAGDVVPGTFNRKTKQFTADESAEDPDTPDTPIALCEKNVTPTHQAQEILPDAGYYGMSKVVVEAIKTSYLLVSDGGTELVCEVEIE